MYNSPNTLLYNPLTLPHILVKEDFVQQASILWAKAVCGHNTDFLVTQLGVHMFRSTADSRVKEL
jgi:hypothetical protein